MMEGRGFTVDRVVRAMGGVRSGRAGVRARVRLAVATVAVLDGICLALVGYVVARTAERDHSPVVVIPALLAFTAVGAVIVWRRPGQRMGWLLLVVPLLGLVGGCVSYGVLFVAERGGPTAGAVLAAQILVLVGDVAIFATLSVVFLAFPDGCLLSRRWRWVVALTAAAYLLVRAAQVIEPGPVMAAFPGLANPFGMADRSGALSLLADLASVATLAFIAWPVAVVVRYRRSRGAVRQQMKWLAYSTVVWLVFLLVDAVAALPAGWLDDLVLLPVALLVLPVGVGVAILRYRLYDIDRVVDRTLLYAALTACVVAVYAVVVMGLSLLVPVRGNLVGSLAATVVVAFAFQPLRQRLQAAVNRLMYGDRDDPYRVLSRLGHRLSDAVPGSQVAATVVETVAGTLKLPYAAVSFTPADGDPPCAGRAEIAASTGRQVDDVVAVPLSYRGDRVGDLLVAARSPGEPFSGADRRLLTDLARQCGAALYAARQADHTRRLATDLQRARRRLVGAREEERRRLRRDLHDGLGPDAERPSADDRRRAGGDGHRSGPRGQAAVRHERAGASGAGGHPSSGLPLAPAGPR